MCRDPKYKKKPEMRGITALKLGAWVNNVASILEFGPLIETVHGQHTQTRPKRGNRQQAGPNQGSQEEVPSNMRGMYAGSEININEEQSQFFSVCINMETGLTIVWSKSKVQG